MKRCHIEYDMGLVLRLSLAFCLTAPMALGQMKPKGRVVVHNTGDVAWQGRLVSIPWSEFSSQTGVTDTAMFRLVEVSSKREVPIQLERMGGREVRNLLFPVSIPVRDSAVLRVEKVKRSMYPSRTFGRHVPERKDDFAWENDRIAFRAYGKALESTNENAHGFDVWVKRTKALVIDDRYRRNDYHEDHGDGLDYYSVGFTLGAGNIAPFWKDSVWYPGNYSRWEVLDNGPLRTTFRLHYDPVTLNGIRFSHIKTISLDAGTYMNRITVQYDFDGADSIPVAIGIVLRKDPGVIMADEQAGLMSYWEPVHPKYGTTGVAVTGPSGRRIRTRGNQLLMDLKLANGQAFTYHAGACWDREGVFKDDASWVAWVRGFQGSTETHNNQHINYR
jgi:hypothetical protein